MTAPRKRKAPEKRPVRRPPGLFVRTSLAAGHAVAARPSLFGGVLTFGVIFSFVAANALWYQPRHPSPFMNTRDAFRNYQPAIMENAEPQQVTTFKIERQGSETKEAQPAVTAPSVIAPSEPKAANFPESAASSELILQIQQQLANLGFYDGTVDGQMGSKTATAILLYQNRNGMVTDGQPSLELLSALRVTNGQAAILPTERPSGDVTTNSTSPDPVAAAIEDANDPIVPTMTPPEEIPAAKPAKAVNAPKAPAPKQAAPKAAPAKAAAQPKKTVDAKPVARPTVKTEAAKAPKAKTQDVASLIATEAKAKPKAKPTKATSIDDAEALPAAPVTKVAKVAKPKSIDTAEALPAEAQAKPKPKSQATQTASNAKSSSKVLKIQQGLARSYPGIAVNGVAGPETKAAIRNFEKNYNMPVTGEPSDALLKKMKDVGFL